MPLLLIISDVSLLSHVHHTKNVLKPCLLFSRLLFSFFLLYLVHARNVSAPVLSIADVQDANSSIQEYYAENIKLRDEVKSLNNFILSFQEEKTAFRDQIQKLLIDLQSADAQKCEILNERERYESRQIELENDVTKLQDEHLFLKSQNLQFLSEEKSKLNAFKILSAENTRSLESEIEKLKSEKDRSENGFSNEKEQYLLKRLFVLENELKLLTETASTSNSEIEDSNVIISKLQNEIESMIASDAVKEKERVVKEEYLLKRVLIMEKELMDSIDDNSTLNQEIESTKILMHDHNQLNSALLDEKDVLSAMNEVTENSLLVMTESKNKLERLLESSNAEIDLLKAMSFKLLNEKVDELQRSEEEKKRIISNYSTQYDGQLALLHDQITELRSENNQIESLKSQITELRSENTEIESLKSQITELRSENTEIASLKDQVCSGSNEILSLKDQITDLRSRNTEIALLEDQIKSEIAEILSLKDQIKSGNTENESLKTQVTELKSKYTEIENLKHKIKSENTEIASLKDEITVLKSENTEMASLREQLSMMSARLTAGQERVSLLESEAEAHAGEREDTAHEIDSLTSLIEELTSEKLTADRLSSSGGHDDVSAATSAAGENGDPEKQSSERERRSIEAQAEVENKLYSLEQLMADKDTQLDDLSIRLNERNSKIEILQSQLNIEREERNRVAAEDVALTIAESNAAAAAAAAATLMASETLLASVTNELDVLRESVMRGNTEISRLQSLLTIEDDVDTPSELKTEEKIGTDEEYDAETRELKRQLSEKDDEIKQVRLTLSMVEDRVLDLEKEKAESDSRRDADTTDMITLPGMDECDDVNSNGVKQISTLHRGNLDDEGSAETSEIFQETELSLALLSLKTKNSEVEELQYSVDDKVAEIEQLSIFVSNKDAEIDRLRVLVHSSSSEVEHLKSCISGDSATASLRAVETEKLNVEVEKLNALNFENVDTIGLLRSQVSTADTDLDALRGILDQRAVEIEELRTTLMGISSEREDLKSQLTVSNADIDHLKLMLADLTQSQTATAVYVPEPETESGPETEADLRNLISELDELKTASITHTNIIEELKSILVSKNSELDASVIILGSRNTEIENLRRQLCDHIRENDEVELLFNKKIIENDDLKSSLSALKVKAEQGMEEEKNLLLLERESQKEKDVEREIVREMEIEREMTREEERKREKANESEREDATRRELELATDRLLTAVAQADMLRTQLLQVRV